MFLDAAPFQAAASDCDLNKQQWHTQDFGLGGLRIVGRLSKESTTIGWHRTHQKILGKKYPLVHRELLFPGSASKLLEMVLSVFLGWKTLLLNSY